MLLVLLRDRIIGNILLGIPFLDLYRRVDHTENKDGCTDIERPYHRRRNDAFGSNDTLLVSAIPDGPTCHKGTDTCWGEVNEQNPLLFLTELQDFINRRHEEMPEGSYTTSLFKDGINRIAQKVGEESLETIIEATNGTNEKLIYEASDMIYHLIVLLTSKGLRIEDVAAELAKRHDPNWDKKRREAKAKGEMK